MQKYFYAMPLLAFSFGMMASVHAKTRADYQLFPVHLELTKSNYDGKNAPKMLMPFNLPQNVPDGAEFVGVKGTITAISDKSVSTTGVENTDSVAYLTLFSANNDACPTNKEESVNDADLITKYNRVSYANWMMRQGKSGEKILDINYNMPQGFPLKIGKQKCMFLQFSGGELNSKDYTIKADLEIKYKIPSSNINPNIKKIDLSTIPLTIGAPDLNYMVHPVIQNGNISAGALPPGTITSVFGNVGIANLKFPQMNNWNVKSKVVVYKNGSCEKAFPNYKPISSNLQKKIDTTTLDGVTAISDQTVEGNGIDSILIQTTGNDKLPVHVEDGDCVVQVFANSNVHPEYNNHGYLSEQSQTSFSFIQD